MKALAIGSVILLFLIYFVVLLIGPTVLKIEPSAVISITLAIGFIGTICAILAKKEK